jgi:3-isopropylmalate/(R)-2-methylmalate dehydratase small subunit
LTIELSEAEVQSIFEAVASGGRVEAVLDLAAQTLAVNSVRPLRFSFGIDAALKEKLLHGRDDIALTLAYAEDIARFESGHDAQFYGP